MKGFEVVRQVLSVFAWMLGKLVGWVIGPMTWQPPAWSRWVQGRGHAMMGDARRRPLRATMVAVGVAGIAVGGVYAHRWWESRPPPVEILVTVTAPPPTPIVERPEFLPVVIGFSTPVAPLVALGKPVTSGVAMSPSLEGTWRWRSDHELIFVPKA